MSGDAASVIGNATASTLGNEALKEALKNLAGPLSCVSYISLARELYILGKDAKSLILPNKEEQSSAIEVKKETRIIKARRAFENCLIKAHNNSSSADDCVEEEFMFSMRAGKEKTAKKKAIFNKYQKNN